MTLVPINQPELGSIDFMRVALSEPNQTERLLAIKSVKLDIEAARLENMAMKLEADWMHDPSNANFVRWIERRRVGDRNSLVAPIKKLPSYL